MPEDVERARHARCRISRRPPRPGGRAAPDRFSPAGREPLESSRARGRGGGGHLVPRRGRGHDGRVPLAPAARVHADGGARRGLRPRVSHQVQREGGVHRRDPAGAGAHALPAAARDRAAARGGGLHPRRPAGLPRGEKAPRTRPARARQLLVRGGAGTGDRDRQPRRARGVRLVHLHGRPRRPVRVRPPRNHTAAVVRARRLAAVTASGRGLDIRRRRPALTPRLPHRACGSGRALPRPARPSGAGALRDLRQGARGSPGKRAPAQRRLPRDNHGPRRPARVRRRVHRPAQPRRGGPYRRRGGRARPQPPPQAHRRMRGPAPRHRQDRRAEGDHQQARDRSPTTSGRSSRSTPSRVSEYSTASAGSSRRSGGWCAPRTSAGTAAAIPTAWPARRSRSSRGSCLAATRSTP